VKLLPPTPASSLVKKKLQSEAFLSALPRHHFKQVTSMSPLRYQKQLRLIEARRLMLVENSTAAIAADKVGYESPSQFSREYSRMFGAPPICDIVGLASGRRSVMTASDI
jgi:AraC-like DNA-binding protein